MRRTATQRPATRRRASDVIVVAGMPRTATTWLYHNLGKHPGFFLPFRKESNYFSVNHEKGIEWYESLFRDQQPGQVSFDISPYYFIDDSSIPRMLEHNPDRKVILGLREPASFALSFYAQHLNSGYDVGSFANYINEVTLEVGGKILPMRLTNGFLSRRFEEYRQAFSDRLLVYDFARLRADPLKLLRGIEAFCGVSRYFNEDNYDRQVINAGNRKNSPLFNWLLRNETFIGMLDHVFPRGLVQSVRRFLDKASKPKTGESSVHSEENKRIAEAAFAPDRDTFQRFLDSESLRLGTGEALPP